MAGVTAGEVSQRDMLGAVATAYRAAKWPIVVDLHGNRSNPRAVSGPDLLVAREGQQRVVKVLGTKGKLSDSQEKMRAHYEAAGFEYIAYGPDDFPRMVADAE